MSSAASTYQICIQSQTKINGRGFDTTVGFYRRCIACKLKFSYAQNIQDIATEMDHTSLPLDARCRAAEVELGQRARVARLLLVRSPSNSRLPDPLFRTAGHRIPRIGSPERRKCTASKVSTHAGGTPCGGLLGPDHTVGGGEWRWLVETHAKP